MRSFAPILAAATLLIATGACSTSSSSEGDPITIGEVASIKGAYAQLGVENSRAVQIAVDQINANGGVLGRKLKVIVKDDNSQAQQSVQAFESLRSSGVAAVVGAAATDSELATLPSVDKAQLPYISLSPAEEQVKPIHPYVFLVPATTIAYADRILQYFKATGISRITVAYDGQNSYGTSGFAATKALASRYGVRLVATKRFESADTDFTGVFDSASGSDAQALLAWGAGPTMTTLAKQHAGAGVTMPLVLTGAQASALWLTPTGKAAEGVVVASAVGVIGGFLPEGSVKKAIGSLSNPFQAKYGHPPSQFAQDGYTAVQLIVAAIDKAGSTEPSKVRAALEGLALTTPNGKYRYSKTDHAGVGSEWISINVVKDGAFVPTSWAESQFAVSAI